MGEQARNGQGSRQESQCEGGASQTQINQAWGTGTKLFGRQNKSIVDQ